MADDWNTARALVGDEQLYGFYPHMQPKRPNVPTRDSSGHASAIAEALLGLAPGSGEAMSSRDAWNASGRAAEAIQGGEWGQAAREYGNTALGLLGALPGAGIIARGTQRGAAWMDRNLPAGVNKLLDAAMPSDPKNQLNIFAGPNAKTADHVALANAQEMAGSGANRDDIWRDTGWYQGVDGKWRFEIDDSTVDLTDKATKSFDATHSTQGTAREIVDHPALWEAYPDLGNTATLLQKGPIEGSYYPTGVLHASAPDYQNAVSVNLHELQHGAQLGEGFDPGGNWRSMAETPLAKDLVEREFAAAKARGANLADEDIRSNAASTVARQLYQRLAGEVEARNVQSRMNMSPVERRANAPWLTQDVPDDQQIVRYR